MFFFCCCYYCEYTQYSTSVRRRKEVETEEKEEMCNKCLYSSFCSSNKYVLSLFNAFYAYNSTLSVIVPHVSQRILTVYFSIFLLVFFSFCFLCLSFSGLYFFLLFWITFSSSSSSLYLFVLHIFTLAVYGFWFFFVCIR